LVTLEFERHKVRNASPFRHMLLDRGITLHRSVAVLAMPGLPIPNLPCPAQFQLESHAAQPAIPFRQPHIEPYGILAYLNDVLSETRRRRPIMSCRDTLSTERAIARSEARYHITYEAMRSNKRKLVASRVCYRAPLAAPPHARARRANRSSRIARRSS
jgi:hypothetical protein